MLLPTLMYLPAALIALVVPKYIQARLAARLGGNAALPARRLSWNPLVHLDLLGAAMLVFFRFGWSKPLMLDPVDTDGERKTVVLVSAAGPFVNLVLGAFGAVALFALISASGVPPGGGTEGFVYEFTLAAAHAPVLKYGYMLLFASAFINFIMVILNLVPIPPFDFGGILKSFLSAEDSEAIDRVTKYVGYALVALVFLDTLLRTHVLFYALYTPASYALAFLTGTRGTELYELFYVLGAV